MENIELSKKYLKTEFFWSSILKARTVLKNSDVEVDSKLPLYVHAAALAVAGW